MVEHLHSLARTDRASTNDSPSGEVVTVRELERAAVVLVAQEFNPSILSEHWLAKNGIITDDPEQRQIVLVPGLAQIVTRTFVIEARADRFQVTIRDPLGGDAQGVVSSTAGQIAQLLPETPYSAVGLNFHWQTTTRDTAAMAAGQRSLFAKDDSVVHGFFASDDARFGAYASTDSLGFRLKLNIVPTREDTDDGPAEGLNYQFNFHRNLPDPDTAVADVGEALAKWSEARDHSGHIFETTTEWVTDATTNHSP